MSVDSVSALPDDDSPVVRAVGPAGVLTPRASPPSSDRDAAVDGWLVAHAKDGHVAAFEELVRRHQDRVFRIAYRMLGSPEDAQDVAQEVLLRVWTSLGSFAGASTFTTWLYRIVINTTITAGRRPHRRVEQAREDVDEVSHSGRLHAAVGGESVALDAERSRVIVAAVARLSPDVRSVFVLRHFEELSYLEIGEVMGLPEPTVRGRLSRARQQLTVELREWR